MGTTAPTMDKAPFFLFLLFSIFNKSSQKDNCNDRIAGKLVSLDNENWPGYQLGIHREQKRVGIILKLSLVWSGETHKPGTLWMTEKCRDQVCFSRYRYDQREMGDHNKNIADEKNYFFLLRSGGFTLNHVWQRDLNEWKEKKFQMNMMATSSGWVEFSDRAKSDEWKLRTFNKDMVPAWQLGPSSALRTFASSTLILISILLLKAFAL